MYNLFVNFTNTTSICLLISINVKNLDYRFGHILKPNIYLYAKKIAHSALKNNLLIYKENCTNKNIWILILGQEAWDVDILKQGGPKVFFGSGEGILQEYLCYMWLHSVVVVGDIFSKIHLFLFFY
ncbi:hypothetical protein ACJX0J_008836, partial [Zea mays]